jgi:hypothetical protein
LPKRQLARAVELDAIAFEHEIPVRMEVGIGHHHEMDARWLRVPCHDVGASCECSVVELRPYIAGDDQCRAGRQKRQRRSDAAGAFQRMGFQRPPDAHAERIAVTKHRDQLWREPRGVDDDVAETGARQRFDLPDDERPAARRQQCLGHRVRQRPHAVAAPGGQNHRAVHQNV